MDTSITSEELDELVTQYKRQRADYVLSTMHQNALQIKRQEVDEAFSKLDLDAEDEDVVMSMADAIVSQILAEPTERVCDAAECGDWETVETIDQLFGV